LKKEGREEAIPCILEPQGDEKTFLREGSFLFQPVGVTEVQIRNQFDTAYQVRNAF
jgi:hypothetical protein